MTNMKISDVAEADTSYHALSADEKAQLHLWASATPAQRLAWLEEVLQFASKAGALNLTRQTG